MCLGKSERKKFGSTNQLRISTALDYEIFLCFRSCRADSRCLSSPYVLVCSNAVMKRESGVQFLATKCEFLSFEDVTLAKRWCHRIRIARYSAHTSLVKMELHR